MTISEEAERQRDVENELSELFDLPSWFWTRSSQKASGFFHIDPIVRNDAHKAQRISRFLIKHVGNEEPIEHIDMEVDNPAREIGKEVNTDTIKGGKIDYHWLRLSFSQTWKSSGQSDMLCFMPPDARDGFEEWWMKEATDVVAGSPLAIYAKALEYVTSTFDYAVWSWRNIVRDREKNRKEIQDQQEQKHWVISMHEIARHIIHTSEMLEMTSHTFDMILAETNTLQRQENPSDSARLSCNLAFEKIKYLRAMLKCIHLRSQALEKRNQNEMNMVNSHLYWQLSVYHSNTNEAQL
jgi:hypothetical protein